MMMWGLCLPNTCTPANIFPAVNATVAMLLGQYGIQASPDQIECGFEAADKSITDDPLAMGISIFTLLLLALVAVATAEEMWTMHFGPGVDGVAAPDTTQLLGSPMKVRPRPVGLPLRLLACFSLRHNVLRLLALPAKAGPTDVLNGLRVISMLFVLTGHSILYINPGFSNFVDIVTYYVKLPSFAFISDAVFAVDTFFFMSAFLATYNFLKRYRKETLRGATLEIPKLYLARYLRLTPLVAYVVFAGFPLYYFGSGPVWQYVESNTMIADCRTQWWYMILYISVYWSEVQCQGHMWYLANDMIFFILTPPLLVTYTLVNEALAMAIMVIMMLITFGLRFPMFDRAYYLPYARIAPYIYGIWMGLLYERLTREAAPPAEVDVEGKMGEERERSDPLARRVLDAIHHRWVRKVAFYVPAAALLVTALWWNWHSTYKYLGASTKNTEMRMEAFYYVFAWGLGLTFAIVPMLFGYGSVLRRALAHHAWIPLARLTYACYLIHPNLIYWLTSHTTSAYQYTPVVIMYLLAGNYLAVFVSAAVIWLVVEKPFMNLLALFIGKSE
eukprot:TRINITY_DN10354_c0_g2_i5.p1 TRINITY_DN10354_c0_g2~~TRINITY_DN10354_c0_g2_i5.p1  ORF type:complete len:559 (+),score=150.89 TRINITY_DN10354_c0_g2_i5:262-1938(+)